jgi:CRISPR-associated endonuclease/helicase Cas3
MKYAPLLAKSHKDGHDDVTLADHTKQVVEAAEALFGTDNHPTRLGECWLRFFGLDAKMWPMFHTSLIAACVLHDWGKANDGFQDDVHGRCGCQAIRHEHLSALLIGLPEVTKWLESNPLIDVPVVLSAVMTHHLKARNNSSRRDGFAEKLNGKTAVRLSCDHGDFRKLVGHALKCLGLDGLDLNHLPKTWQFEDYAGTDGIWPNAERIKTEILDCLELNCGNNDSLPSPHYRLLMAVRAALIAADAAGSGLIREGKPIVEWIGKQFPESPRWNAAEIWQQIITPRKDQIDRQRKPDKKPFEWNDFQSDCDNLPSRALLLAPCGSGKTLAAWRWIAAQAKRQPIHRAIFLYPTRATAKEGFRDYVSWAPEAALMHATAEYDLDDMFTNEDDPRHTNEYETERRLFALGFWPKTAFSATVDQFLAFMQYSYSAVCMLPVLADSVVVIDEVHSFDQNMFSALKRFLQCFDVPVLCMTATLTPIRQEQLKNECGLKVYDKKPGKLGDTAKMLRYKLTIVASRNAAAKRVADAFAEGRRVLWVVNTVTRCHEVLKLFVNDFDPKSEISQLTTRDGYPIYCYHSRFRLDDRRRRHEDIVTNMKPSQPACLGTTTQVCEMSLDLDVDLLVTEYCPVTSLIQRLGRCNREQDARPLPRSGEIIVYDPEMEKPYDAAALTGLNEFLEQVQNKEISQLQLENALADVPFPPDVGDTLCSFLKSGPYASTGEGAETFREDNDYNRQCVRFEDVKAYLNAPNEKKPGFVLPVPNKLAKSRDSESDPDHRRLPRYFGVAAPGHYHTLLGYCDQPLDQWRVK